MLENGRGLIKALENWAKKVTTGYKDVDVRDLSTSFRDGLAFCAIIHYYRPDLFDFESLSKENIFENNSLAFSVAEKQLGVPALLDAEDMVKYSKPDRLSIITYLSQLRNCFENQNKVKKHDLKRIQRPSSGPPAKVSVVEPSLTSRRHEMCQVCKHRVFILERLIVDGKLYHTTCFRCHKCNNLLSPGAYVESDTNGVYECSVCPDEVSEKTESILESLEEKNGPAVIEFQTSVLRTFDIPDKEFASNEAVTFAKSNLSPDSPTFARSNINLYPLKDSENNFGQKQNGKDASSIVKNRISVFENSQTKERPVSSTIPSPSVKLRPFSVANSHNETGSSLSNRFSTRQSLISSKTPEKWDNSEKESLSAGTELAKDLSPTKELPSFERYLNSKSAKTDSDKNANVSSFQVPDTDLKQCTNETQNFNQENKTGGEPPKSPRITRDIFKTSLSPLKLNLSSNVRKEGSSLPIKPSPIKSSESEKSFDIPEIKLSQPVPLPRTVFGLNPSESKQSVVTNSENGDSESQNRRSSLESTNEPNFENNTKHVREKSRRSSLESRNDFTDKDTCDNLTANSKSFVRTYSTPNEIGFFSNNLDKSSLKNYTSVYKSIYNTPNLGDREILGLRSDISYPSLPSKNLPEGALQNGKDERNSESTLSPSNSMTSDADIKDVSETFDVSKKDLKASPVIEVKKETSPAKTKEEEYPDDLNPFGDDECGDENVEEYPDDLNPFGDDDDDDEISTPANSTAVDYDESKNPFASYDDDESDLTPNNTSVFSISASAIGNKAPNLQNSFSSNVSSPSGSLKGTIKKRQAPKPPNVSDIFSKDSGIDSSFNSVKTSPAVSRKNFSASSPKLRKSKPAPLPPPSPSPSLQDPAASMKKTKETDNMKLKSSTTRQVKKKRPAPPVPIPMRRDMKKIPLQEIIQEMKEIEAKQREYERQGRDIELLIRDRDKDEEASVEEEEYIMQLFELVNQKNGLFRRQAELMYIKRSQRLEEQQYDIEKAIRQLMEKPDSEKTDADRQKEEELTMELIDIVDQRNSIIDSIEMDRRRELEEDHSVQEQLEMKNGDLPIAAEIKQKSGKNKKNKEKKKDKKKKEVEDESGKGTLKKKKNLFSKRS